MLPRPEKIIFTDGFASQNAPVEERLCPELSREEYRIDITADRIVLTDLRAIEDDIQGNASLYEDHGPSGLSVPFFPY